MPENFVFVAGSAHLDVLARVTGDDFAVDKIGDTEIEIGGTACNIAINIATMKQPVRLLTAMETSSPYSAMIVSHLKEHGVDVIVAHCDGMRTPIFTAHIGRDGEIISAVSSTPVETAAFGESLIRDSMTGAICAILECNLSANAIDAMARVANEIGIPVFIGAVSEEKSLKLAQVDENIYAVFMNRREMSYFARKMSIPATAESLSAYLGCNVISTLDSNGAIIVEREKSGGATTFSSPPPQIVSDANTLGAGDALLAATVINRLRGKSLSQSVELATQFAGDVIGKRNCSAGKERSVESSISQLHDMATKDPMTGALNRRAGEKALASAHRNAQATGNPYSVLMLDIDHFKKVNDTLGHDAGDEAIKTVCCIISRMVRDNDAVSRWGGEEFLCVIGVGKAASVAAANRIRLEIEAADIPMVGKVTVSIGVAAWSADIIEPAELIKLADNALYAAKRDGRNRVEAG